MDLLRLSQSLQQDALAFVFLNVLAQQMGLPVPAVPTLLLAGSLAASPSHIARLLAAAVLASVLADWLWYLAGRRWGYRVLAGLCRLSLNPASCVTQTESRFTRWGVSSLLLAKFIPGFSTVAPPIAGALRMRLASFLLAAGAGGALWAGLALAVGWMLRDAVHVLIVMLDRHLGLALMLVLALAGLWLAWKVGQRWRHRQARGLAQLTPDELLALVEGGGRPRLLDLRGALMVAETGPVPGAIATDQARLLQAVADWPRDQPVVTFCACPEDASAIQAARRLQQAGWQDVKPLRGGFDALRAVAGPRLLALEVLDPVPR
ncbi:Rhodanese domain-containing protein [Rubrivivax sp. A210]|uniref:VTT domain-containing protein n=1 Tax=Rubrivivax sp. A210 TaxID=2772301 RepID=UPI001919406C|nr:VTT domain-containing protein [Rubrivivax sp. A210]CAD5366979.1 Rhodanese domain-containing protein [Rubrivivax sp. A210]